jgi:hypothetical protein
LSEPDSDARWRRDLARRLLWFGALWLAGVAAVATLAFLLRKILF